MTTLDDKLLGEKCQYYYSSSSDDEDSDQERRIRQSNAGESDGGKEGSATNTEYNQLNRDDDEDFLEQYRKQRIEEMKKQLCNSQVYKQVFDISSGQEFLDTVDKEHKSILVIILIYEDEIPGAEAATGSIMCLASEYPGVKFCRVKSSLLRTSSKFTENALPALLVYKSGELIGNFVRITDQLGEDFFAVDLEAFLRECSLLPEKDLLRTSICNPSIHCYSDDSDLDID
ncbi:hypothetical protein GDO78_013126 [Eleutherodactylus coqui]|uniref:Phosducin domain-containing protein n=1 Tax=Eleutherodactylus coqui TaxID=57060 RepID=A0A8J6K376_ELECQ|nr:hypothetical protein GDO78_013126 [Eleutherodactylus coqui]